MNCVFITGTVINPAQGVQQKSCGLVSNFRIAIDSRPGKRATEATISCFDDLARYVGQYLAAGERVAITGSLSHMSGRGLVISANQIARMGPDLGRDIAEIGAASSELNTSPENS